LAELCPDLLWQSTVRCGRSLPRADHTGASVGLRSSECPSSPTNPKAAGTSPEVGCRRERDVQTYFDCRPTADWERAIFTGYRVCHRLRDHGGGGVVLDADDQTLTLETDGERHGLAVEDDDVMS